jgi:O-antigen/teichoic acid export membrane protein
MLRERIAAFHPVHWLDSVRSRLRSPAFWRAGGLLMLANAIVTALGLVRTPLITWMLPKEEVGMLAVVASWLPFVQLLSMAGMDAAAYHYVARGQPWAFVVNLFVRLRWSLLSAAAFLLGALYWAETGQTGLAWMFVIAAVSYPVTTGMTASAGMLGARERFAGLFWYRILESLTDFAGFIPLAFSAWVISRVVTFYASNQLFTALFQVAVSFGLAWQVARSAAHRLAPGEQKEMLRYGRHLTAISAVGVIQSRSDALIVAALSPLSTIADYSIALLVGEQFKKLWNIYVTVRYPPLVRLAVEPRRRRMIAEGAFVWTAFLGLGLLVALLAHWLVPLVLPAAYASSLVYMDLLIATAVAAVPGSIAEMYFRTQQDEKRQYQLRIFSAIAGSLVLLVFALRWGAYGAAAGRLVSSIILSALGAWLFLRSPRPAQI